MILKTLFFFLLVTFNSRKDKMKKIKLSEQEKRKIKQETMIKKMKERLMRINQVNFTFVYLVTAILVYYLGHYLLELYTGQHTGHHI